MCVMECRVMYMYLVFFDRNVVCLATIVFFFNGCMGSDVTHLGVKRGVAVVVSDDGGEWQ